VKFLLNPDIRTRKGLQSNVLAALLGLVPLLSLAQSSSDAIPLANAGSKSADLPLAATVGELLKRDANDALRQDVPKDASNAAAVIAAKPVIKGADPYLTAIFGMEGARVVRLQLADKPILTYVENARDRDKREPVWRLLAVQGKCAYFEHLADPKKKAKPIPKKVCYGQPQVLIPPNTATAPSTATTPGAITLIQSSPSPARK
jgi:hypothetical protein